MNIELEIKNNLVKSYLDNFDTEGCIENQLSFAKGWDGSNYEQIRDYSLSDSTLYDYIENKTPIKKYSFNKIFGETACGSYFLNTVGKLLGYDRYYTSAYVPKGFVGWHADSDIAGYYLMFTYSKNGSGYFKIRDPKSNKIFQYNDEIGWMLKIGIWGIYKENIYWHCANADSERYTFLLVYDDEKKYNDAIKIITNENAGMV